MGRASFWAAPAWAGRGAVPDGLSQPGWSIRGPPLAQPLPIPTFTPPTWRKAALGFGPASVVPQSSPPASARWVLHRRGVCSFFFLKQRDLLFASCWPSPKKMIRKTDCFEYVLLLRHPDPCAKILGRAILGLQTSITSL